MNWYKSNVSKGDQLGRTLGFPTLNLDPTSLNNTYKEGVYAALVEYEGKEYKGMLYLGPRLVLHEARQVLEINVFDFDQEIYDKEVLYAVGQFIRPIANFDSLEEMKKQLQQDKNHIEKL